MHFGYLPSGAWRGDGMCYLYDVPTHEAFVCDSFLGEDDLPDGDRQNPRAPAKRNTRPREVMPHNPFREVNAGLVQASRSNPSTADLLAGLKAE